MDDSIKELSQHLSELYTHPDPSVKSKANEWLQNFQKTDQAWITADVILKTSDSSLESKLFAAQSFRSKITFDLDQLPPNHRLQLRESLLSALEHFSITSSKILVVQLCLALADLALQLPEWPTVVADMTEKYGKNPETVPALIEFLTVLPQEMIGNSKIKITNHDWSTPQVAQLVSNTLSMYLAAQGITTAIKSQIFTCFSAWLKAGEIPPSAVGSPFLLTCVFGALDDDDLFEHAIDLVVDLIHETQEVDDNMSLIEQIVSYLVSLQLKLSQVRDDSDKMRGYCRIFVEAGEWYIPLIIRHPESFLPIVHAIKTCCGYDDLEIVTITINFWYRLSKALHSKKENDNVKPLINIFADLVEIIIRHLHYPDDLNSLVGQEADDFRHFRHEIGGTLKDCCYVLGASICLKRSYDKIVLALANEVNSKWQDIEAPLFSMRTMGAEVDPKDDSILPMIMEVIPRLPTHPKIRYATILVLCRYTEWTNFHPDGIPFQLSYISSGFEDPSQEVRLAAAQAMKYLCRDCSQHLVSYLPQLHSFYQSMSLTLSHEDMNEVSTAIAHIIATLPVAQSTEVMSTFCMPLVEKLHNVALQKQPFSKQVEQEVSESLERIDIFLSIVHKLDGGLPPQCAQSLEQVWTVFCCILALYSQSLKISERFCAVMRRGLIFFGDLCLNVLISVLEQLTIHFETSGCSGYLWITSKVVSLFADKLNPTMQVAVKTAFERQSNAVFSSIKDSTPELISDVIEDYIYLLTNMIEKCPEMIISSPCFAPSFPVVLTSLEFFAPGPLSATLNYIREILGHSSLENTSMNGVDTPVAPAGFTLLAQAIQSLIIQHGYPLCEILLRRLLTDFPEDTVSSVIALFRLLSDRFPNEISAWLPVVAENLPERAISFNEKQKFLSALREALSQRRSDLVKEAILSIVKVSRRERARRQFHLED
ncbi:hypothetical protein O181_015533 [Austropuccinia psidii MF-1]|uniref:Importin N-terminal domain-containing protein n=1 Tax=Austropuccinia psidii MF-1 TaxID=1389203 RepID=A0A9Q3C2M8_9BASI|nr:hypothetical protein [Austropuccinia psidii MF-1]